MQTSRYFFALWPNPVVTRQLADLQRRLPVGRLTHREDFHLTLAFLGELPASIEPVLVETLHKVPFDGFEINLDRIGVFKRIHLAWAGPSVVPMPLLSLYERLAAQLDAFEIWFDRHHGFQPHVTLARKLMATPEVLNAPVVWWADRVVLARSESGQCGQRYKIVAERMANNRTAVLKK